MVKKASAGRTRPRKSRKQRWPARGYGERRSVGADGDGSVDTKGQQPRLQQGHGLCSKGPGWSCSVVLPVTQKVSAQGTGHGQ